MQPEGGQDRVGTKKTLEIEVPSEFEILSFFTQKEFLLKPFKNRKGDTILNFYVTLYSSKRIFYLSKKF